MNVDPAEITRLLPFEERYERRHRRWADGPYESWVAFDRVLEREVVLNIPWSHHHLSGFIKSAKVAASLRHPGLLPVFDLGVIGGSTPYYTTPHVPGRPLSVFLGEFQGESFPTFALIEGLRDACRALDYAHRRGFLHLDLHAFSLLINEGSQVMIEVDGWIGASERPRDKVGEFQIVGHLSYMSPEQVNEAGPDIGPATDVFGLGGLLHLILFGTPPNHLPGSNRVPELIKAIACRSFEPRRPGTLRPGIGSSLARWRVAGLVDICLKALAYEPEGRYSTAAEMGDGLEDWLTSGQRSWWEGFRRRWPTRQGP